MNDSNEFDLFAAPEEDNLHEQLAKGNFEWSNKTTRILGVLALFVATLSAGAWYGHHTAASATPNVSALRSAFSRAGAAGGFGGASGFAGGTGGASGFASGGAGGFGTSAAGNISKISGNTVTITVADPSSLKEGDTVTVRVRPAGAGGFGGGAAPTSPGAPAAPSSTGATSSKKTSGSAKTSGTTSKPSVTGGAGAAPSAPGTPGARGGGMFSNPAFTACLTKEGVTIAPGSRPDRTDPKVAAALQKCLSTLGITPGGGGGGGGFGGNRAPGAGGSNGGTGTSGTSGN